MPNTMSPNEARKDARMRLAMEALTVFQVGAERRSARTDLHRPPWTRVVRGQGGDGVQRMLHALNHGFAAVRTRLACAVQSMA
jgi:hypothetical protein